TRNDSFVVVSVTSLGRAVSVVSVGFESAGADITNVQWGTPPDVGYALLPREVVPSLMTAPRLITDGETVVWPFSVYARPEPGRVDPGGVYRAVVELATGKKVRSKPVGHRQTDLRSGEVFGAAGEPI
ncbi:MAG TPA: hypothetical protein VHO27_16290, partial [Angustibacter sp.]|nr:hypothetical protein [Angustibacter sp.]